MILSQLKAVGSDRGVVAQPFHLGEGLLSKDVRSTPDGRLDVLGICVRTFVQPGTPPNRP